MSTYPANPGLYEPTQDERTMALLVYILGIFSGFIAPLIFFLVKRESKFVAFHSLQALAWHVIYFVCIFGAMVVFFISMIASGGLQSHAPNQPPWTFLGFFAVIWIVALGGGILNIVLGVLFGIKANKGEWVRLALLGDWILNNFVF